MCIAGGWRENQIQWSNKCLLEDKIEKVCLCMGGGGVGRGWLSKDDGNERRVTGVDYVTRSICQLFHFSLTHKHTMPPSCQCQYRGDDETVGVRTKPFLKHFIETCYMFWTISTHTIAGSLHSLATRMRITSEDYPRHISKKETITIYTAKKKTFCIVKGHAVVLELSWHAISGLFCHSVILYVPVEALSTLQEWNMSHQQPVKISHLALFLWAEMLEIHANQVLKIYSF